MGTWGIGSLENDGAAEFVIEFEESGAELLLDALEQTQDADYLERPQAERAVAAAEIVATLRHSAGADPDVLKAIAQHADRLAQMRGDLEAAALAALDRIMDDESELKELWEDAGDDYEEWSSAIADLVGRLKA